MKQTNKALKAKISELESEVARLQKKDEYNGWSNYETWNVALWFGNDSSEYWNEEAQTAYDEAEADKTFTKEENAVYALAAQMKDNAQDYETYGIKIEGFCADLLNASLRVVDWHEIARHYMEEVDKEAVEA
jgi:hypothetical protein